MQVNVPSFSCNHCDQVATKSGRAWCYYQGSYTHRKEEKLLFQQYMWRPEIFLDYPLVRVSCVDSARQPVHSHTPLTLEWFIERKSNTLPVGIFYFTDKQIWNKIEHFGFYQSIEMCTLKYWEYKIYIMIMILSYLLTVGTRYGELCRQRHSVS